MAVIVQYVVVKDGVEKMTFATKKEADAYDKMLDIAENLYGFLDRSNIGIEGEKLDELTFFLAQHSDEVAAILKGGSPKKSKDGKAAAAKTAGTGKTDAGTDTDTDTDTENPPDDDKIQSIDKKNAA